MNINQLERDLVAKKREARNLLDRVTAQAETEGRAMTRSERNSVQELLDEGKAIKAQIDRAQGDVDMNAAIERLTGDMMGPTRAENWQSRDLRSLGEQFVANEDYRRFIRNGGHRRAGTWISPFVEATDAVREMRAATLTTNPASGGALILPDTRPGIIPLPQPRLVIADLIAPGTTDSNIVQYMKETTFTNAADAVAEGALKPESTLVFTAASSQVSKYAHWIPVTEEMLEDYAQTRSIIDARLRLGLDTKIDQELLNGNGVAPSILGFTSLPGLAPAIPRGTDSNIDAIRKQIAAIATSVFVTPTGIVMHPQNWLTVDLAKTTTGEYLARGPFAPPGPKYLWGLPVADTSAIAPGVGLVGDFRSSAQVFRKGGVRVEASNSHSDFFVRNLVAIRAEERLALAVYREAAFGLVTGLE